MAPAPPVPPAGWHVVSHQIADTPVATSGGGVAFADRITPPGGTRRYKLRWWRNGKLWTPDLPAISRPWDVDAGPGPDGAPLIAATLCTNDTAPTDGPGDARDREGCRPLVIDPRRRTITRVRVPAGAVEPAVSGTRLAYVRGGSVEVVDWRRPGAPRKVAVAGSVEQLDLAGGRIAVQQVTTGMSEPMSGPRIPTTAFAVGPLAGPLRPVQGAFGFSLTAKAMTWIAGDAGHQRVVFADTSGRARRSAALPARGTTHSAACDARGCVLSTYLSGYDTRLAYVPAVRLR